MKRRALCIPALLLCGLFLRPFPVEGETAGSSQSLILIHLSGETGYPGWATLLSGDQRLDHLCLLGAGAQGNLHLAFLKQLTPGRIPEGAYRVAPPFEKERWPVSEFVRAGALRLKAETPHPFLKETGLQGLALHGRDFYPLLMPVLPDKKMIRFYDRQLFGRLARHWGPLRLSNWDMNRLYDFWKRHTRTPAQWRAEVRRADPSAVRERCRPPEIER